MLLSPIGQVESDSFLAKGRDFCFRIRFFNATVAAERFTRQHNILSITRTHTHACAHTHTHTLAHTRKCPAVAR